MSLKAERKRLNLLIKEVAEICSVSEHTVIRWEKGSAIPSDKLALLAERGFDVSFIVTGKRLARSGSDSLLYALPHELRSDVEFASGISGRTVDQEILYRLKSSYDSVKMRFSAALQRALLEMKHTPEFDPDLLEQCVMAVDTALEMFPGDKLSQEDWENLVIETYHSGNPLVPSDDVREALRLRNSE